MQRQGMLSMCSGGMSREVDRLPCQVLDRFAVPSRNQRRVVAVQLRVRLLEQRDPGLALLTGASEVEGASALVFG